MLINIDLDRLKVFWAVARELSFSHAAEKLFRTQSAVSQSIRQLERELGEQLFVRSGRRVTLTPAGRILAEHVEDSFASLARGRAQMQALRELREGALTVSAGDTTTRYALPTALRAFRQRYPGVEVRISNCPSPKAAEQVLAGDADIAVVTLPVEHNRLHVEALQPREDVVICAPGHRLASRATVDLAELAEYPLALLDQRSTTRQFLDARFSAAGLPIRVAMELGSIEVIKRMVELDFGISIAPKMAVEEEVSRGTLHSLRVFAKKDWRVLAVAYPKAGIANVAAEAFTAVLRKTLKR